MRKSPRSDARNGKGETIGIQSMEWIPLFFGHFVFMVSITAGTNRNESGGAVFARIETTLKRGNGIAIGDSSLRMMGRAGRIFGY